MLSVKFRIYFADFFEIDEKALADHGAFNISLINDLPLFIDPFLLFTSDDPRYKKLHDEIIEYVLFLKKQSAKKLPDGLIQSWFYFPEIKENWLGYSRVGNRGRGLGSKFAHSLKYNLTTVLKNFGEEPGTQTHIEKLTLVRQGVGKDQISDFTCNLIAGYLAEYTQAFAKKYIHKSRLQLFTVPKVKFDKKTETWTGRQFLLPRYGKQFVLLTPVDILTKDESWINHKGFVEDFSAVMNAVSNPQLRGQIDNYFISVLPIEANAEQHEEAIEKVVKKYPELLDYYIALKEKDGDGARRYSTEKLTEATQLFVKQLKELVELLGSKTKFYGTGTSSYQEAMTRISYVKDVIEKQDGYRLFYIKGRPVKREQDLQIVFKLVWFASIFDINAEVNNGRGPADFIVSYGSKDKVAIEFKLASNKKIEQNLKKQAEIYSDAAKATHPPIKVILYFSAAERQRVQTLLSRLKLDKCKDIVLIDATPKASGSLAK